MLKYHFTKKIWSHRWREFHWVLSKWELLVSGSQEIVFKYHQPNAVKDHPYLDQLGQIYYYVYSSLSTINPMIPSGIYTSTSLYYVFITSYDIDPNQSLLPRQNKRRGMIYIRTEAILREINLPYDYLQLIFSLIFLVGYRKLLCTMTSFMISCNEKLSEKCQSLKSASTTLLPSGCVPEPND